DRIELFDNSHLFGTFYVGGMVVYKNMEPARKEYRKYKISTDVKDDLSAMKEVIYRRYYKVLLEDLEKPDLIIVDGGELQVNATKEVLDSLNIPIKVIGLKKDDKHKTSVIVDSNNIEIPLPKDNNLFLYLTRMQDEVHHFAITYHRDIKTKGLISSILDNVSGIGDKRKKELLKKYKSITKIKEASIEELSKIIPENVAIDLKKYLSEID
ncbi:MAG: excinuclease ABC subunit C, partial [bacterium]|nr:excinuclease ABC subunit C [bacterium]